MILADRRISARMLADSGDTSGTCRIYRDVFGVSKLSAKWPCCGFTGNSWTPLKEQSRLWQWKKCGYTCTIHDKRTIYGVEAQWFTSFTNFRKQKSASKMMASVFSEKDGIMLVDCLERGTTIPLHTSLGQSEAVNSSAISPGQRLLARGCQYTAVVGWAALWSADHLLWPLQTVIWNLKKVWRRGNFRPLRMTCLLQPAQPAAFCLDDLKKLEQRSKQCAEVRREFVQYNICVKPAAGYLFKKPKTCQHPLVTYLTL